MSFSFIIPAYNIEAYLPQCLDSVIPVLQGSDEIIIPVGMSDDKTDEIAFDYSKQYTNISVVEQNGKGLSDARNCALQLAKGDYLFFVDGDDFVYTGVLKDLLSKIRDGVYEADWIMTDYYTDRFSDGSRRLIKQVGSRTLKGLEHFPEVMQRTSAYWPVWRGAYRAAYLRRHGLDFCDTIFNEDADFTARLLATQPDVLFVDAPYYHYRKGREGSLMTGQTLLRMQQNEAIFRRSIELLRGDNSAWRQAAVTGLQYGYVMNMALLQEVSVAEREVNASTFRNWQDALIPSVDKWIAALTVFLRVLGVRCAAFILHILKIRKRKMN